MVSPRSFSPAGRGSGNAAGGFLPSNTMLGGLVDPYALAPLPPYARRAAGMERIAQPNISGIPETQIAPEIDLVRQGIRTETMQPIQRSTGEIGTPLTMGSLVQDGGTLNVVAGRDPLTQSNILAPTTTVNDIVQGQVGSTVAAEGGGTVGQSLGRSFVPGPAGANRGFVGPAGADPSRARGTSFGGINGQSRGEIYLQNLLQRQAADAARRAPAVAPETAAPVVQPVAQAPVPLPQQQRSVPQIVAAPAPVAAAPAAPAGGPAPPASVQAAAPSPVAAPTAHTDELERIMAGQQTGPQLDASGLPMYPAQFVDSPLGQAWIAAGIISPYSIR